MLKRNTIVLVLSCTPSTTDSTLYLSLGQELSMTSCIETILVSLSYSEFERKPSRMQRHKTWIGAMMHDGLKIG
jgi:hypothetical protein